MLGGPGSANGDNSNEQTVVVSENGAFQQPYSQMVLCPVTPSLKIVIDPMEQQVMEESGQEESQEYQDAPMEANDSNHD